MAFMKGKCTDKGRADLKLSPWFVSQMQWWTRSSEEERVHSAVPSAESQKDLPISSRKSHSMAFSLHYSTFVGVSKPRSVNSNITASGCDNYWWEKLGHWLERNGLFNFWRFYFLMAFIILNEQKEWANVLDHDFHLGENCHSSGKDPGQVKRNFSQTLSLGPQTASFTKVDN